MTRGDQRSIPELVGDALSQSATLIRNEVELARAEAGEKFAMAARGAILVGVGLAFVIPAIVLLLMAIAAEMISDGFQPSVACLAMAVLAFVIAGAAVAFGASRLSAQRLKPQATLDQMRRDRTTARELMQ